MEAERKKKKKKAPVSQGGSVPGSRSSSIVAPPAVVVDVEPPPQPSTSAQEEVPVAASPKEEPPAPTEESPAEAEAAPPTDPLTAPETTDLDVKKMEKDEEDLEKELTDLLAEYERVRDRQVDVAEPNLFDQPVRFERIVGYKHEIERPIEEKYLVDFEQDVQDEALLVGAITLDEVQVEEKRLREAHLEYEEQEKEKALRREEELKKIEEEVKQRLAIDYREKKLQLMKLEELIRQQRLLAEDELKKSFKRSEQQLTEKLEIRKGEVTAMYGDLRNVYGKFDGTEGRRWKVDWDNTPQPIQIKLLTVRGVRDKLPRGRYVLTVSLFSRLGGDVMRWSNLKGQYWGSSTIPVSHSGRFTAGEMKMEQSVFTVLPARPSVKPGMVVCFELYLLRGAVMPSDTVVGWGAFPICSGDFHIIEGKFKAPLLRGCMDPSVDKHDKIEELMASDLDNWLCNIYFQIIRLPRYQAGQREHEVELQFSSDLLNFPDRVDAMAEDAIDGEDPLWEQEDVQAVEAGVQDERVDEEKEKESLSKSSDPVKAPISDVPSSSNSDSQQLALKPASSGSNASLRKSLASTDDYKLYQRKSYLGSRAVQLRRDGPSKEEALNLLYNLGEETEQEYRPLLGEEGVYYKHHRTTVRDDYQEFLDSLLPETPQLRERMRKRKLKLSRLQELETHKYAVRSPFDGKGKVDHEGSKRMAYVGRMFLSELGLSQWRSREFWLMLLMLIFSFFLRMIVHYVGQWSYLQSITIPINSFVLLPYTVQLNYQPTLLKSHQEIAVVLMGPIFNISLFILFGLISLIAQLTLGAFPDICSKFVLAFGTMTLLDPLLILIVDLILGRQNILGGTAPIADAAKLYWHYYRAEGSGLGGIILTCVLYIFLFTLTMALLYIYFLRLHNEGRMLDIFWRLHGMEDNFFVPYDMEVSHFELGFIVKKAEQWRGEEGERRKIIVTDYIWEEEAMDEFDEEEEENKQMKMEVTTHLAIHTVHLDGLKELYRHFLRLPDGGIIEVFGDNISMPGMNEDMKLALQASAKEMVQQPIPEIKISADVEEVVVTEESEKLVKKEKKKGNGKEQGKDVRKRRKQSKEANVSLV